MFIQSKENEITKGVVMRNQLQHWSEHKVSLVIGISKTLSGSRGSWINGQNLPNYANLWGIRIAEVGDEKEILNHLNAQDLIRLMAVSKIWKKTIQSSSKLWKNRINVKWGNGVSEKILSIAESSTYERNWVKIYGIPLWKERYFAGDHQNVWKEIRDQQNLIFENSRFYEEACLVTEEMMKRVRTFEFVSSSIRFCKISNE